MPMKPPPRDQNGVVEPHDHPDIAAADGVIRRIPSNWVVPDKDGSLRLSSMAFKASSGVNAGMSVDLEALIVKAGIDPKVHVTTPRWVGSIRYTAGQLRDEQFQVGFDPLEEEPPEPANPFHGEVWGDFPRSKQRRLSEFAEWFVPIPDVRIYIG